MSRTLATLAAAALAGLAGCAHIYPCAEHGGPGWRELLSENFALRTSLDEEAARVLVSDLETLRAAQRLVLRTPDRPDRLTVYALRGPAELAEFVPFERAHLGGRDFSTRNLFDERSVVIDGTIPVFQQLALQRRLAWEAVHQLLLRQPTWAALGLVAYLEAVEVRPDERIAVVGRPLDRYTGRLISIGHEPVEWMLRADERPQHAVDGGSAWLLVHLLFDEQLAGLTDHLARLARGEPALAAFQASFPGATPAQLDARLEAFRAEPKLKMFKFDLPVYRGAVAVRPLPDARLHSARADLLAFSAGSVNTWRYEVEETLRLDPGDPIALAQTSGLSASQRAERLQQACAAHPTDSRVWLAAWAFDAQLADDQWAMNVIPPRTTLEIYALVEGKGPSAGEERLQKAAAANPDDALASLAWGAVLLKQQQPAQALPVLEHARALRPTDWLGLALHAQALADLGRCGQALAEHETVLSLAQFDWPERYQEPLRERAAALRKSCGP